MGHRAGRAEGTRRLAATAATLLAAVAVVTAGAGGAEKAQPAPITFVIAGVTIVDVEAGKLLAAHGHFEIGDRR